MCILFIIIMSDTFTGLCVLSSLSIPSPSSCPSYFPSTAALASSTTHQSLPFTILISPISVSTTPPSECVLSKPPTL